MGGLNGTDVRRRKIPLNQAVRREVVIREAGKKTQGGNNDFNVWVVGVLLSVEDVIQPGRDEKVDIIGITPEMLGITEEEINYQRFCEEAARCCVFGGKLRLCHPALVTDIAEQHPDLCETHTFIGMKGVKVPSAQIPMILALSTDSVGQPEIVCAFATDKIETSTTVLFVVG